MNAGQFPELVALLKQQRTHAEKLNATIRQVFPLGTLIEYPLPGKVRVMIKGTVEKHKCQGSRTNVTLLVRTPDSPTLLTKTVSDLNVHEISILSVP